MTAPAILERLEALGFRQQQNGWTAAACPAHEDKHASFGWKVGTTDDGRATVVLRCQAGCTSEEIVTALGATLADLFAPKANGRTGTPRPRIVRTTRYEVRDAAGSLVATHVRHDRADGSKDLPWELPDGTRNLGGRSRDSLPLYGSERIAAWPTTKPVVIVEGEKAAAALTDAGVPALGTVTGADGCPDPAMLAPLSGRSVVLWADADQQGRDHMRRLAAILDPIAVVGWIEPPADVAKGWDAADAIAEGRDIVAILAGATVVPDPEPVSEAVEPPPADAAATVSRGPSQAAVLLGIVDGADVELFHALDGTPYATVPVSGHRETHPVRSSGFADWLRRQYHRERHGSPSAAAMADVTATVAARARFDGPTHPVALRVAEHSAGIVVDVGDAAHRAVVVEPGAWRVTDDPPVRFRRSRSMLALPDPTGVRGELDRLRPYLNAPDDAAWRLLVGWLLGACRPRGPYPLLVLTGEQGSAKSSTARRLRDLIDPNASALRAEPRDVEALMVAAVNGWIVALDNVSRIRDEMSDALCRLATGGGLSRRTLYTDADETIIDATRPAIITAIGDVAARGDLLDRAVIVELPRIDDAHRRLERDLDAAWDRDRPAILAGLLDALAGAIAAEPSVHLARPPRMADFATFVVAAEPALGWESGAFLRAYATNRGQAHELAVEASRVAAAIRALAADASARTGTASELLATLTTRIGQDELDRWTRRGEWPKGPRGLADELRRLAPNLRALDVDVAFTRQAKGRRVIAIERMGDPSSPPSPPSPGAWDGPDAGDAGDVATPPGDAAEASLWAAPEHEGDEGDAGDAPAPTPYDGTPAGVDLDAAELAGDDGADGHDLDRRDCDHCGTKTLTRITMHDGSVRWPCSNPGHRAPVAARP